MVRVLLVGAVLIASGLLLVWAIVPDVALGALLILGVSSELLVATGGYVIQRRRHW